MKTPKPEKQKRTRRAPAHYVNNKEFSQAVVDYVNSVNKAREDDTFEPNITPYIGTCFLKISEGLSHKPNFYSYTYREEMVMDAVENCIKAIMNYDVDKATRSGLPNAFAYFTQISYYAFLRRIAKEKRQQEIKERYIDHAGVEAFAEFDDHNSSSSIVDRVRHRNQQFRNESEKTETEPKAPKKVRAKKKYEDPFDSFYAES